MKKFLSLVLALVMTMSLVTISAGAADYEDDSKIQYNEAVDVVSALKIVGGYADGTFNPTATLTRGAASKIICNLILGPTTASALVADAAPYKDVPADSTFAGYIAYCAKQGIISGYADGTFRPGNTLTGYAFMKMLLGALGYDAALEGYTGNNWSIAVAKQAIAIGLEDGLAEDFNGVKAVTREEACLYALNTITAAVVSYDDKGTNITIGDTTINTGASQAAKTTVGNTTKLDGVGDGAYVQFGEKYFKDLKADATENDDFGRPAVKWTLKAQEIDTYAKTPALTYTESVKGGDIYKDLGKPSVDSVTVYTNGTYNSASPATSDNSVFNVKKDNALKIGGNGITVEVFTADVDDDNKDEITVVAISNFAEKVQTVTPARGDNKRYVTLENGKKFETNEFDVDDIVVYTEAWKAVADSSVKSMVLAEKVADVDVDKINYTKSTFTDGSTTYDFAAHYAGDSLVTDSTFDVYTDVNGNVVYIEETAASIAKYAVVLATKTAGWSDGKDEVRLLLVDGSEVVAKCESVASLSFMDVVTYTVDKDGVYTCTKLTGDATREAAISDGSGNDIKTGVATLPASPANKYANAETVFVVATGVDTSSPADGTVDKLEDIKIYTGIKNVPDVDVSGATTAAAYFKASATMADLVLLVDVTAGDDDVVFLSSQGYAKITNRDGNDYYQFKAVVNGEITTLDIDAAEALTDLNTNSNDKWDAPAFMLTARVMNSKDIATSITDAAPSNPAATDGYYDGVVATSFRKDTVQIGYMSGSTITGEVDFTVDDDVTVYVLDNNGDFTAAGASALAAYEKVLFKVKDGMITTALVYTDLDTASSPWVG